MRMITAKIKLIDLIKIIIDVTETMDIITVIKAVSRQAEMKMIFIKGAKI